MIDNTVFTVHGHFATRPDTWKVEMYRSKQGDPVLRIGDLVLFLTDDQAKQVAWEIDHFFAKEEADKESSNAIQP